MNFRKHDFDRTDPYERTDDASRGVGYCLGILAVLALLAIIIHFHWIWIIITP